MNSLKRMLPFVKPYFWIAFFLVLAVILPVAMELVVPKALNYIIDEGIQTGDMEAVWRGSAFILGSALFGVIATLGQGVYRALLSQGLAYDMRNHLFSHIQTFSFANLDKMQTGQLMTRLSSDVDLVRSFFSHGLSLQLRALMMIIGSMVMMFVIHWRFALIMLVLLPLAAILIISLMRFARPLYVFVQERLSALNTVVQENLAGVGVVRAFVRENFENKRFQGVNEDYMQKNIRVGRLMAIAMPVLTLLTNLGIVVVIWLGGLSVNSGNLTMGELVAFNNYVMIGMAPLMLLGNTLTMVSRAEASAERLFEALDTQPAVDVIQDAYSSQSLKGSIVFDNVSFRYDQDSYLNFEKDESEFRGGRKVLNDITFEVRPGQRIALLGATGSGKSTLVNLIPRFYDVEEGHISVDGVDLRNWDPESLRKRIGVVLQQTTLFSGSVRDNIAYGYPDAPLDDVIAAAKIAQAHEFIMRMPDNYDSNVEERGANLSGGQKQRIAIARALLISPSILIFDDSTSSVDMETENKIQVSLGEAMAECTTFVIAQRISSVLDADKILVLEHGHIVAQGTHKTLLSSNKIYQEIYQSQMGNGSGVVYE